MRAHGRGRHLRRRKSSLLGSRGRGRRLGHGRVLQRGRRLVLRARGLMRVSDLGLLHSTADGLRGEGDLVWGLGVLEARCVGLIRGRRGVLVLARRILDVPRLRVRHAWRGGRP